VWRIEYSPKAAAALLTMPADVAKRVRAKIETLAADPRRPNNNVKRLRGRPGFRLRIGDWRVIYALVDARLVVLVIDVGPRSSVYE
jgi:mRNA interferase RelE/StbE